MPSTWQVIVVRAWCLGHRRIIRLTLAGDPGSPVRTHYVASSTDAAELLRRWLDEAATSSRAPVGPGDDAGASGEPGVADDA